MNSHQRRKARRSNGQTESGEKVVSELIGRSGVRVLGSLYPALPLTTVDTTKPDYKFWDELRWGLRDGYRLGGLFALPIVQTLVSFALGRGVSVKVDGAEKTTAKINQFLRANLRGLVENAEDGLGLGDAYIVVNADGSLSQVPPNQMEIITDELNPRNILGYTITTKLEKATITDEYTLDNGVSKRRITTKLATESQPRVENFSNQTGLLPVDHFATFRRTNELYGKPLYVALRRLFEEYDDVMTRSLSGVKLMGTPVPVAEGLIDPEETQRMLATRTETVENEDGSIETVYVVSLDDVDMFFIGAGGRFHFASPSPFTEDAGRMLEFLFLLMLQHTRIPEGVWGGAIASSKASLEAQMPSFVLVVDMWRLIMGDWLKDLIVMWTAITSLYDPSVRRVEKDDVHLEWPDILGRDETIMTNKLNSAHDRGVIRDETYLGGLDLPGVDDPAKEVELAREEREANMPIDQQIDKALADALNADVDTDDEDIDEDELETA